MLNELSRSIRFDNASKGFDPTEGGINRYILLTISELCEAQNEIRDGRSPHEIYYEPPFASPERGDEKLKPCGFAVEIADAIIRILDICGKFEQDLESGEPVPGVDFEAAVIDDWLLGAVNIISDCFNYDTDQVDFWYSLRQGMGTLFLLAEKFDIPMMQVIDTKLDFNRTRPPKHGRQF